MDIQSYRYWHSMNHCRCWIKCMWLILLRNKEQQKNSELMTALLKPCTKRFDHTWTWLLVAWGQVLRTTQDFWVSVWKNTSCQKNLVLVAVNIYSKTLYLPFLAFGKNISQLWISLWDVDVSPTTQECLSGEVKRQPFEIKSSGRLGLLSSTSLWENRIQI